MEVDSGLYSQANNFCFASSRDISCLKIFLIFHSSIFFSFKFNILACIASNLAFVPIIDRIRSIVVPNIKTDKIGGLGKGGLWNNK